ncbi:MAG: VOC family protein [Acidobacteriota bacterium]|nr:VOC family protein [Acidobacteriota bacterium]MDH3529755.1 VOC family protein [Acidobacteriota bacterium]
MKLLRLHHVQITIPVGSEAEALEFYCGLLGLREIPKPENVLKRGGFWVEIEGLQIHIGVDPTPKTPDSKEHLAFLVDKLEDWRTRFESGGVNVKDGKGVPGLKRFDIRDPFNNRIEFLEETNI